MRISSEFHFERHTIMRQITITCVLLAAAISCGTAKAEDIPKRSAELQVLERLFIGTWDSVVTNKTTGEKFNTIEKRRWSDKGKFVLSEEINLSTKKESHFLITYDPNAKKYRSCYIEEGGASIIDGAWDEETKTMSWSSIDVAGNRSAGKSRFIDKDHVEWSLVVTNSDGEVLVELATKQTRRKK